MKPILKKATRLLALGSAALCLNPWAALAQGTPAPAKPLAPAPAARQPAAATADKTASILIARGANGASVSRADVLADAQRIPEVSRGVVLSRPDNVQRIAEGLVVRRSLAARAEALNLLQDPQLSAELQQARDKVLSDAYLRHVANANAPAREALERFALTRYQAEPARFAAPAQTRASHILLSKQGEDALGKAEKMLQALKDGASFEELARKESIDYASAARGGDLGLFGEGRMVKAFEDAVKVLQRPGELSGVVETQFGYHIIRLDERRDARTLPFEEVKEQLMAETLTALRNEKRDEAVNAVRAAVVPDPAAVEALSREFSSTLGSAQKP